MDLKEKNRSLYSIDCPILSLNTNINKIHFIKWEEVEHPFMKGYDVLGRLFVVIKIISGNKKIMKTYYLRNTIIDDFVFWCPCVNHSGDCVLQSNQKLTVENIDILIRIINGNGENIKIENIHKPILDLDNEDRYARLYDEKKENAATIIQRNWRLCRYNPKYTMCQKIQYDGLKSIYNS